MSPADADRWDAKHSASQAQLIPLPPIAFSDHEYWLESLTCKAPSRALDVACGCGECATWLAERGFHVLGLDISTVALEAGAKLASTIGVGDRLVLQQVDLDAGMHVEGPFELVICQRFRDTSLYSVMQALVAPGGLLAVTVLSEVGWEGPPSRFRACPGELQKCFFTEGFHVVFCSEEAGEATAVLRRAGGPAPTPGARPAPLVYLFGLPGAGKNYCGELLAAMFLWMETSGFLRIYQPGFEEARASQNCNAKSTCISLHRGSVKPGIQSSQQWELRRDPLWLDRLPSSEGIEMSSAAPIRI